MAKSVAFVLIPIVLALISVSFAQNRGLDKEKGTTKPPNWAPSFPGFGFRDKEKEKEEDWRGGNSIELEEDEDDKYFVTYTSKPKPHRTTEIPPYDGDRFTPERRTSARYPNFPERTTTPKYFYTTTTKAPWYSRLGKFAKDKFNSVYNKISG